MKTPHGIDPVRTYVIGSHILAIAEEMGVVLIKTAYSTNIKERADSSTAIFDAQGRTIAQASHVPVHLASLMGVAEELLRKRGRDGLGRGDMFIANDPYLGIGSQLNDITVAAPVFADGQLLGFVTNTAHHSDIGGTFPGSENPECGSIFEEGLRLPLVRLVKAGEVEEDIVDILVQNSRTAHERRGDLQAQIAANRLGARRLGELCGKYGVPNVTSHMEAWLDYSEHRIRKAISRLPRGVYRFSEHLDEGSVISLALTIRADSLEFDFTGTSPQVAASHNVMFIGLLASVYYATKAFLDPDIPPNAGYYRAIQVLAPKASIINPDPPAAVSTRALTCQKVVDTIMGALAQVAPARAVAGCAHYKQLILGAAHPGTGRTFVTYEINAGGYGARSTKDGMDVVQAHITNTPNLPIESLEQEYPLLVERYEMVADTGGPGKFRGGLGARRDTRMLADGVRQSGFSLGHAYPGFGLLGGHRGRITAPSMLMKNFGTPTEESLHPASHHRLSMGDVLSILTPGGGGFGHPFDRDPARVERDAADGKVSAERALADYGVVLRADGTADLDATEAHRGRHRSQPDGSGDGGTNGG